MRGRQFLDTAMLLRHSKSNEAHFRSAMSRAYYACFLEVRVPAFNLCNESSRIKYGISKIKEIKHNQLPVFLKNSQNPNVKKLGIDLGGMLGMREDADYDMTNIVTEENADDAINNADALIKHFDSIPPKEIGKALTDYFDKIIPSIHVKQSP